MGALVRALGELGVPVQATDGGYAPLRLAARRDGRRLHGGTVQLEVPSAQLKSAVMLAGLVASAPVTVIEPSPSRDHTERMLRSMGLGVLNEAPERVTLIPTKSPLRPLRMTLPGDISSAAFLITAALILPGSSITVQEVGLNLGRTGLLEVLSAMGAQLAVKPTGERGGEPIGQITAAHAPLRGAQVSGALVPRMIDEFPALAVAAVCAHGETRIRQAESLRGKESDRIAALVRELRSLGANIEEHPDGFTIHGPTPLRGGVVHCHGDHRLAMALTIAGLAAADPVTILGAEVIDESFPAFPEVLRALGAKLE
jgi:3-phosphoshikimate 1-carboxyvinyltransferase